MAERLRGRRGVEQRKRRLRLYPLCAECERQGLLRPTDEIDHIVPLHHGGEDTDENCQGLCTEHHFAKTAGESGQGAATHPDWLRPSAIPLTIICGPPCSGKTTYVQQHAKPGDTVIDLDSIRVGMEPSYRHWSGPVDVDLLKGSIRKRNAMLGSLSKAPAGRAWFIVSAPSKAERDWWQSKLGGDLILLHPGIDECSRRAVARGTPLARAGIVRWEQRAREPWQARTPRPTIGLDGWPVK